VIAPHRPHGPAPESDIALLVIAKQPLPGQVNAARVRDLAPVLDPASSARSGGGAARERQ
jgi:hypothetical protein